MIYKNPCDYHAIYPWPPGVYLKYCEDCEKKNKTKKHRHISEVVGFTGSYLSWHAACWWCSSCGAIARDFEKNGKKIWEYPKDKLK